MKFTIHNGPTTLEFEGGLQEFERLAKAVEIPRDLLASIRAASGPKRRLAEQGAGKEKEKHEGGDEPDTPTGEIDVRELAEQLGTLGAKSDIDRVTVMAHAAHEAGLAGIDYDAAERLFVELGERKPSRIRATFQNAKARGLVRPAGRGTWAPTVAGENYARLGHKKPKQRGAGGRSAARSEES